MCLLWNVSWPRFQAYLARYPQNLSVLLIPGVEHGVVLDLIVGEAMLLGDGVPLILEIAEVSLATLAQALNHLRVALRILCRSGKEAHRFVAS